jgi:hypothetical protein
MNREFFENMQNQTEPDEKLVVNLRRRIAQESARPAGSFMKFVPVTAALCAIIAATAFILPRLGGESVLEPLSEPGAEQFFLLDEQPYTFPAPDLPGDYEPVITAVPFVDYYPREFIDGLCPDRVPQHDSPIRQPHTNPETSLPCDNSHYVLIYEERVCSSCGYIFSREQNDEIGISIYDLSHSFPDLLIGLGYSAVTVEELIETMLSINKVDSVKVAEDYDAYYAGVYITSGGMKPGMVIWVGYDGESWVEFFIVPPANPMSFGFILPVAMNAGISHISEWGHWDGGYHTHTGIDFTEPEGADIYAVADGTVMHADWLQGYGLTVTIAHAEAVTTLYAHCSELLVEPGEFVTQGQTIARVGKTGVAADAHLHFEVFVNGENQNPRKFLGIEI